MFLLSPVEVRSAFFSKRNNGITPLKRKLIGKVDKQLIAVNLHTPRTLSGRAQETHLSLAVGRQTALLIGVSAMELETGKKQARAKRVIVPETQL